MSDYLTVSQAAARLGISERTVRRRCETGKLRAQLKPTATGTAWHIEADSCGQAADTAAIAADTPKTENRTQEYSQSAANVSEAADGAAIAAANGADTERALGRLEGLALSGLEKSIAQAVENAVALAVAPLALKIDELTAQIEKLEKSGRENAPQAPADARNDQTDAAPKQSAPRGAKPRKLTAWQRIGARLLGIR